MHGCVDLLLLAAVFHHRACAGVQCSTCPTVESELLVLARSYARITPANERTWFFVTAVYPGAQEAFQMVPPPSFALCPRCLFDQSAGAVQNGFQSVPILAKQMLGKKSTVKFAPSSLLQMSPMTDEDSENIPDARGLQAFLGLTEVRVCLPCLP
jgi:hypothetical protein